MLSNQRQIIEQGNFAYSPHGNRQIIEQANFGYSPLGKAFEKQIKIKGQGKKQIKVFIYHGKQLVESNKLIKNDFNIEKDDVPLEKQKIYILYLKKNLLNLRI